MAPEATSEWCVALGLDGPQPQGPPLGFTLGERVRPVANPGAGVATAEAKLRGLRAPIARTRAGPQGTVVLGP